VSTRVLPEPAPARTSIGPCTCAAASSCAVLSPAASDGAAPSSGTGCEPVGAGVGGQRGGKAHGAVCLLSVLEQGDERARKGEPGGVQGMDELRLGAGVRPEAQPRAARLEIGEGAGAG